MAPAPVKVKESLECPFCMTPVRPGTVECKSCGNRVPLRLTRRVLATFLALVGVLAVMTLFYFCAIPAMRENSAKSLVLAQEGSFIEQAMNTIREKQFRFLGWGYDVFGSRLVLVTFTYQDPGAGPNGYLAVWWAVDLERGTATRVKSMQDFADNYLLKTDPA